MLGDLALGQSPPIGQVQGLALQRCQGGEGGAHASVVGPQFDDLGDRVVVGLNLSHCPGHAASPVGLLATDPVHGAAVDDGHDPRSPGRQHWVVAGGFGPDLDERLLNGVLGQLLITQHAQGQAVRSRAEALIQGPERGAVPTRAGGQQLLRRRGVVGGVPARVGPGHRLPRQSGAGSPRSSTAVSLIIESSDGLSLIIESSDGLSDIIESEGVELGVVDGVSLLQPVRPPTANSAAAIAIVDLRIKGDMSLLPVSLGCGVMGPRGSHDLRSPCPPPDWCPPPSPQARRLSRR